METKNLKNGIHSLVFETTRQGEKRIVVSTKVGKEAMSSSYPLDEYEKALACYTRLTATIKLIHIK